MERRGFLARLAAALPALPFLPRALSAAATVPPAVRRSDKGVPRQMDIRRVIHPQAMDLQPYRHGEKITLAVAYDLDADTVTVIDTPRLRNAVEFAPFAYRTLSGGVTVKWIRERM